MNALLPTHVRSMASNNDQQVSNNRMHAVHRLFFAQKGVSVNDVGGYYRRGKSHELNTKLRVAATYIDHQDRAGGARPNIDHVRKECKVSWAFVKKIETELAEEGHVIAPEDIYKRRSLRTPGGPGSISLCDVDAFVLYRLYRKMPTRSLQSYVNWLFYYTGTIVSKSTVSRFFNHGFETAGRLCKQNLVPWDKFRPANIAKAREYVKWIAKIDPRRLKYGDEKSLKGKSIECNKARRDIVSGLVPVTLTDPDWRNTYSIIGIVGIDKRATAMKYRITRATVDADLFSLEIEDALRTRFLRPGDVLVLDNAANHKGKGNTILEEWLWEYHKVCVLFLPARTPEWNPIELIWNILEMRLQHQEWEHVEGSDRVVQAAAEVMDNLTHKEVKKCYKKSGVFRAHRK